MQGRSTPYARSANNQLDHGFRSIESLRQAPCSQLSSMAHRLAVTRTRNVPLLQAISQVAQERLPGFKHTQLCQMLWAYAKIDVRDASLFRAVATTLEPQLDRLGGKEMSNMLWAMAKTGYKDEALFLAAARVVIHRTDPHSDRPSSYSARDLSSIIWAFGCADMRHAELLVAVEDAAVRCGLTGYNWQDLLTMLSAYTLLRVRADALFTAVADKAMDCGMENVSPRDTSNMLAAFATCRTRAHAVFAAAAEAAVRVELRGFTMAEICKLVWAFAVADVVAQPLFDAVGRVLAHAPSHGLDAAAMTQLYQWQTWLRLAGVPGPRLPTALQAACRVPLQRGGGRSSSRFHQSVAGVAVEVLAGEAMCHEYCEPETCYTVDIAWPSVRLALEVDGPRHFLSSCRHPSLRTTDGPSGLKQRLLKLAGWRVISVPYFDWWDAVERGGQLAYLRQLVQPAGPPLPLVPPTPTQPSSPPPADVSRQASWPASSPLLATAFGSSAISASSSSTTTLSRSPSKASREDTWIAPPARPPKSPESPASLETLAACRPSEGRLAEFIEKLVPHVLRHGDAMEQLVASRQAANEDFAFLHPGGKGHEYYRQLLRHGAATSSL